MAFRSFRVTRHDSVKNSQGVEIGIIVGGFIEDDEIPDEQEYVEYRLTSSEVNGLTVDALTRMDGIRTIAARVVSIRHQEWRRRRGRP